MPGLRGRLEGDSLAASVVSLGSVSCPVSGQADGSMSTSSSTSSRSPAVVCVSSFVDSSEGVLLFSVFSSWLLLFGGEVGGGVPGAVVDTVV